MNLFDLFSQAEYEDMLDDRYIRVNQHPTRPLRIINYTESAQYDNEWNNVTKQCRGLIVDANNNVIARPFDKFLNYGQNQADILLLDYEVQVTDKMDGSLGIIYHLRGEGYWEAATRGSFNSDQADFANDLLRERFYGKLDPTWTYLVEIIYPGNRIVLDYGDQKDLVLLGARNIKTGAVRLPNEVTEWVGPRTQTFSYKTLREALAAPQRPNAEGFVVYFPELDHRIKIKQDDYIALHKIVTGLTKRRIWESMKERKSLEEILDVIPDEWHDWTMKAYWDIDTDLRGISRSINDVYFPYLSKASVMLYEQGIEWNVRDHRKIFAELVKDHPYKGFMFMLLSGNENKMRDKMFDAVRPAAE